MVATGVQGRIAPDEVPELLAGHMLAGGLGIVLDLVKSHGSRLVDARDSAEYLDFYSFFGSSTLGMNPPGLAEDPSMMEELAEVAVNKPANSDVRDGAPGRVRHDLRPRAR